MKISSYCITCSIRWYSPFGKIPMDVSAFDVKQNKTRIRHSQPKRCLPCVHCTLYIFGMEQFKRPKQVRNSQNWTLIACRQGFEFFFSTSEHKTWKCFAFLCSTRQTYGDSFVFDLNAIDSQALYIYGTWNIITLIGKWMRERKNKTVKKTSSNSKCGGGGGRRSEKNYYTSLEALYLCAAMVTFCAPT